MPRKRPFKLGRGRGEGHRRNRKNASPRFGFGSSKFDGSTGHKRGGSRAIDRNRRRSVDARFDV